MLHLAPPNKQHDQPPAARASCTRMQGQVGAVTAVRRCVFAVFIIFFSLLPCTYMLLLLPPPPWHCAAAAGRNLWERGDARSARYADRFLAFPNFHGHSRGPNWD